MALVVALATALVPAAAAATALAAVGSPTGWSTAQGWEWIRGRLGSGTAVSTASHLTPDETYSASWTGPVSGSFELVGLTPPSADSPSPVLVDAPDPLPDSGPAVVSGRVSLPPEPGRWIVDVVHRTEAGFTGAQLQALVAPDGTWQVDLAGAAPGAGPWGFRILDAHASFAQVGEVWPTVGDYDGLAVRALVVTDTAYLVDTVPAHGDNTFSFPSSRPGAKVFQLVDTATSAVLAESAPVTGLVRSFEVADGTPMAGRTYTYDQALALLTAVSLEHPDEARAFAAGLLELQHDGGTQDGGFVVSAASLNPGGALPEYRTGVHSVATYALLRYLSTLPSSDPTRPTLSAAASRAVGWLLHQQHPDGPLAGLVTAGYGASSSTGSFDAAVALSAVSTEHNLDAWHALTAARTVLGDTAAGAAADRLAQRVLDVLWDDEAGHFLQGWGTTGADRYEVLDVNSWGAVFLAATGHPEQARTSLDHTAGFATAHPNATGFAPVLATDPSLVWFEGSAGVALAHLHLGDDSSADATLTGLMPAALPGGAFPGATHDEENLGMTSAPAVAATAWLVLVRQAQSGRPALWDDAPSPGASA